MTTQDLELPVETKADPMPKIYLLKYAHKGKGFDGWYDVIAFHSKDVAKQALVNESKRYPDFSYKIDTIDFCKIA